MVKRIAIFGSNGYIGRHLLHSFLKLEEEFSISCFDVQEQSSYSLSSGFNYSQLNVKNKDLVKEVNFEFDFLFYFSGITGTGIAFDKYEDFIDVNESGFLNVLHAIRKSSSKPRIIFPSTRLVYKGNKFPLKEDDPKEFKTIYALNKYNGEQYLEMHKNYFGLEFTIFRICIPFGNVFSDAFSYGTIGFFLNSIKEKSSITLYGNGSQRRTFSHVSDICDQIITTTNSAKSINQIYNIAGQDYSLLEVATIFSQYYDISINSIDWPSMALKMESGDTVFDSTKIENLIDYVPLNNLNDWIQIISKSE